MFGIDESTLAAIVVLAVFGMVAVVWLGTLPGRIAEKRQHRAKDAIDLLAFLGIFFFGIGWVIALIWAHTEDNRPSMSAPRQ